MKATSLAYQRFGKNQCGLGLLLSRNWKFNALFQIRRNIQAVICVDVDFRQSNELNFRLPLKKDLRT